MTSSKRRQYLGQALSIIALNSAPEIFGTNLAYASEQTDHKISKLVLAAIAKLVQEFIQSFNVPGLSIAVGHHGRIIYRDAFGYADALKHQPLTCSHLFRIASLTKPITSTAIFSLIEQQKFGLHDRVFGQSGILGFDFSKKYLAHIADITVHHLLNHTSGGWGNKSRDPMFLNPTFNQSQLISFTLENHQLSALPGTHFDYSNFGYCLLGRVIEKISGYSYSKFVQENILIKCGVIDMQLGENSLGERTQKEVVYLGQNGEDPYRINVSRMDSHGGWIATPTDLVQFAMHVDGLGTLSPLLRFNSVKKMMTPSNANPNYACGWAVNSAGNCWHSGSLPGTSAILVKASSGLCWAATINTRTRDIDPALDKLMWDIVKIIR